MDSTMPQKAPVREDLAGPVHYQALVIENDAETKKMLLLGQAKVSYQDMTLTAAKIDVDWDSRSLIAEGVMDSVWTKQESGDSVRTWALTGIPEFAQGGDLMRGETMTYNFATRKGRVLRGRTAYEDGFYSGQALKMVRSNTLNVADASFTTCDREGDPHFRFWSEKMKIVVNDKVIARPIVFFVGKIPVLALPFGLFPIRKGRHSGILIPRYGQSSLEGRYLRNIGYYWAASNYWDVKGTVDYFEKSGFLFRGDMNYQVRYNLRGSISGSWTRKDFEALGTKDRRWDLYIDHAQDISPTTQLTAHAQLVSSGNFYREISDNREYRLQKEIRSNATLTKRLGSAWSVSVNLNQTRNLDTDETTETLPQVYIRSGQASLWPAPKSDKRNRTSSEPRWYQSIYASYSSQFLSQRSKRLGGYSAGSSMIESRSKGWDHSVRFSASQKLFGWLNLNPGVNYRETWFDRRKAYSMNSLTHRVESREETGFFARRTFDVSASFGTKVYGLFRLPGWKDVKLRHVATPNMSFSYQPDFSKGTYGYFQSVADTVGNVFSYDRFAGSLFGSTGSGRSRSLYFGLQNLFQTKIGDGEQAKKFDLFTWDLSSSYNWETKDYKFSDLYSSLRASPFSNVGVDVQTVYSFYETDQNGQRTGRTYTKDIQWSNFMHARFLRLTNISGNVNVHLQGRAKSGGQETSGEPAAKAQIDQPFASNLYGDRFETDHSLSTMDIPWSLSATLSYSENRANPLFPSKQFWIRANSEISLTQHWKISYQAQWDMVSKKVISQDFTFYRDLHCWEAQIVWTPTGYYKRFYFRINIKSPMLKEIRLEKGTGGRGLYGGY